jgi:hypothetical protein
VEKLRKALEKEVGDFSIRKAESRTRVNGAADFIFSGVRSRRASSELVGPFTGGVEDTQQLYGVASYVVRNNVRRARNNQLASAGYPTRTTESREMFQSFNRSYDRSHSPGRSIGIVLGDVLVHGNQVRARRS